MARAQLLPLSAIGRPSSWNAAFHVSSTRKSATQLASNLALLDLNRCYKELLSFASKAHPLPARVRSPPGRCPTVVHLHSFFFWVDIAGTVSLILDIQWLAAELLNEEEGQALQITRAGRAARIGAQIGAWPHARTRYRAAPKAPVRIRDALGWAWRLERVAAERVGWQGWTGDTGGGVDSSAERHCDGQQAAGLLAAGLAGGADWRWQFMGAEPSPSVGKLARRVGPSRQCAHDMRLREEHTPHRTWPPAYAYVHRCELWRMSMPPTSHPKPHPVPCFHVDGVACSPGRITRVLRVLRLFRVLRLLKVLQMRKRKLAGMDTVGAGDVSEGWAGRQLGNAQGPSVVSAVVLVPGASHGTVPHPRTISWGAVRHGPASAYALLRKWALPWAVHPYCMCSLAGGSGQAKACPRRTKLLHAVRSLLMGICPYRIHRTAPSSPLCLGSCWPSRPPASASSSSCLCSSYPPSCRRPTRRWERDAKAGLAVDCMVAVVPCC